MLEIIIFILKIIGVVLGILIALILGGLFILGLVRLSDKYEKE